MTFRMVEVEWVDSSFHKGWWPPGDLTLSRCFTIGWLIDEGEDKTIVAMQYADDGKSIGEAMAIPRVCVVAIRDLKRARK